MEKIPFFKELRGPVYRRAVPFARAELQKDEFEIDPQWKIVVPEKPSEQNLVSARDLKDFLKARAGIKIGIARPDEIKTSDRCIFLKVSSKIGKPESYRIKYSPENIFIEGADDSGVMYGVFYLEEMMKFRKAPHFKPQVIKRSPILETRIFRSPMAFFYTQELRKINEAYPDNYLLKMAHHGFNGIWIRGILRELVKTRMFPEFGNDSEKFLENLNKLVRRCTKFGIKVYLYFNEPKGFRKDSEFFRKYPLLKGQPAQSQDSYAFCTSTPEVKKFLKDGMKHIFTKVPGLAGVILITASEIHSHCYSHFATRNALPGEWQKKMLCERCRKRTPQEVVSEIISLINSGVKSASPKAKVIAWNWSWTLYEKDPQEGIIKRIPKDVIIMADFERGSTKITDGFKHAIDEYSLSFVGPSDRCRKTFGLAKKLNHKIFAKLQIGVTHEVASVPYFPLYHKLASKFMNLKKQKTTGAMECWNFGNLLSPNTELANWFSWNPQPKNINAFLGKIAVRDFGIEASRNFVKAWLYFSKASDHYPFSIPFLYYGPQNFGPAYPLFFKKINVHTPLSWLLPKEVKYEHEGHYLSRTEFGDILDDFRGPFSVEQLIKSFKLLCEEWEKGVVLMGKSLSFVPRDLKGNANKEYNVCAAILSQFKSTVNFIEFTHLRNKFYDEKDNRKKKVILKKLKTIAEEEIKNSIFCKKLALKENTLGFHGEAFGYMYTPEKIDKKIKIVKEQMRKLKMFEDLE